MASLTLQPFLAVPGQIPPVPWTSWISLFESYVARSRCAEKVDLLMRFLGAGGRRVLWSLPGPTGTYEAIVAALSGHYQAREDAEKTREDGHKAREGIDKAREDGHKAGGDKDKAREDGHKAREGIDKAREDAEKAWVDRHKAGADKDKAHAKKVKKIIIVSATVGTALLTGIGAVVAAPFVLAGVGFASGGIVAGSLAASMMSSAAVAGGGGVAAGSLVAILQSAGAVGLTAAASAAVAGTGAAVGGAVGGATAGVITSLNSTSDDKKEPGEEDKDANPKKQS